MDLVVCPNHVQRFAFCIMYHHLNFGIRAHEHGLVWLERHTLTYPLKRLDICEVVQR